MLPEISTASSRACSTDPRARRSPATRVRKDSRLRAELQPRVGRGFARLLRGKQPAHARRGRARPRPGTRHRRPDRAARAPGRVTPGRSSRASASVSLRAASCDRVQPMIARSASDTPRCPSSSAATRGGSQSHRSPRRRRRQRRRDRGVARPSCSSAAAAPAARAAPRARPSTSPAAISIPPSMASCSPVTGRTAGSGVYAAHSVASAGRTGGASTAARVANTAATTASSAT